MVEKRVRALVLTGYGINCEQEMAHGYRLAGARVTIAHLSDVIEGDINLDDFQILNFPGGFSFGDHLAAGRALANKLKVTRSFWNRLKKFIKDGKYIWGVCNGFQVMVKLGLLPMIEGKFGEPEVTMLANDSGIFEDRWVRLLVNHNSPCVYTRSLNELVLPCRHAEGKIVVRPDLRERLMAAGYVVLQYADEVGVPTEKYPFNPNGSEAGVAGICDDTGHIFGLMPHPEAHLFFTNHPNWTRKKVELFRSGIRTLPVEGEGMQLFRNVVRQAAEDFALMMPGEIEFPNLQPVGN
ncbi:MAG: phosphoribosylformylglycinamidine synthase subunit PurQ [Cyanobacteria bacterium NC_groundwater_1444_Ag_S-0.65um_54_12]|nr:phosphoribosylformylglycinamidine synthase subunit PurQ [Cyanobacteria bacterium NC_groundwater_1444_Ag_S-0.65um_54_12]